MLRRRLAALRHRRRGRPGPPEIAASTRSFGQTMDPASGAPYAALFPPAAWEGVTIERDVAYGPDPLQWMASLFGGRG